MPVLQTSAQFSADPHHELYAHIDTWVGRGYVKQLPIFRPLPEVMVKSILERVEQVGSFRDILIAKEYLEKLKKFTLDTQIHGVINMKLGVPGDEVGPYLSGSVVLEGYSFINPISSIAASLGVRGIFRTGNAQENEDIFTIPLINPYVDKIQSTPDNTVYNVMGGSLSARSASKSSFAVGNKNLFMHTGLMQRSIGLFHNDDILVSPLARQSPNLIVYWNFHPINITWAFFGLSSQQQFKEFNPNDETDPDKITYTRSTSTRLNKFYFYNSLGWQITPNIEIQFFESVMFGEFNLSYLLPVKVAYSLDSLSDFVGGNLMVGILLDTRVNENIRIPLILVVDDISLRGVVSFNPNVTKKIALETGVEWYPNNLFFKNLKLNYQIIGPYTFSHPSTQTGYSSYSTDYNTLNHTHSEKSLGSTLPPSSHRITLSATITPLSFLELMLFFRLQQHNNPSEGILNGPLNDGSIIDDGYYSIYDGEEKEGGASYVTRDHFDFLTGIVEHSLQFGATVNILNIQLTKGISLFGNVHYVIDYTINKNLRYEYNILTHNISMFAGLKINIQ